MADYGLRVRDGSLLTQVDSTYKNLAFWTKGSTVVAGSTGFTSWRSVTFSVPYNPSSAFAWRSDFPSFLLSSAIVGNTMSVTFLSYIVGGTQATIWWYLFATPDITGFPGGQVYGLRVKNAAGAPAFDSRNQYMKFLAALTGTSADIPVTNTNTPPNFLNYQMPIGTLPAVLQGNMATWIAEMPTGISNPDFMFFWFSSCVRQFGSTINIAWCGRDQGPYQNPINPPQVTREPWSYTVIDVAGL